MSKCGGADCGATRSECLCPAAPRQLSFPRAATSAQRLQVAHKNCNTREETNMKRLFAVTTALVFVGTAAMWNAASGQTGPGWTQVFDGKTIDGWSTTGEANWRVED